MKQITDTARCFILIALDCISNYCLGGDTVASIRCLTDWERELYINELFELGVIKEYDSLEQGVVELTEKGRALVPKYFKAAKASIEEFNKGYLKFGNTGIKWYDNPAMQRIVNRYAA